MNKDSVNVEQLQAEIARLEKLVYVPGLLKCAKCDFRLISTVLNANTGEAKANNEPAQCLNGCGPMWRVSERESGNEMIDRYDNLYDEHKALTTQLEDLKLLPVVELVESSQPTPTGTSDEILRLAVKAHKYKQAMQQDRSLLIEEAEKELLNDSSSPETIKLLEGVKDA